MIISIRNIWISYTEKNLYIYINVKLIFFLKIFVELSRDIFIISGIKVQIIYHVRYEETMIFVYHYHMLLIFNI